MLCLAFATTLVLGVPQEPVFDGLGTHRRMVTTKSPAAQRFFNQGLHFLFAFNHDEAIRSFTEAARLDSSCAMAYWGIATANGPHINNPYVDEEHAKAAFRAIETAKRLTGSRSAVESALIGAASKRFAWPQPADRSGLDRAYARAMQAVWSRFPRDPDVGAMTAEAMMDLRPWDLWKQNGDPQPGTNEIVATLERVFRIAPNHPLGLHLYIHAVEASPNPGRAMDEADRLRNLQPGLGHMVHMPSHIDVRTGKWKEAVLANRKAIGTDDAYVRMHRPIGFYRVYMAHNRHMLAFAAMMRGQSKAAIQAVDQMVASIPADWAKAYAPLVDGFMAMPLEVRKRFGQWDAILAAPEFPDHFPIAQAMRHADRAVAFAAKGMASDARLEHEVFEMLRARMPAEAAFGNNPASKLLAVAGNQTMGEILAAEGDVEGAGAAFRTAIQAESQLRYDEPPDWILPGRHPYGALLVKARRFKEAEAVYRADLRVWPENGWSLRGLADALAGQGRVREADAVRSKFNQAWADADLAITSSCMCIPGRPN